MTKKIEITPEDRQAYLGILGEIVTEGQYSAYGVHTVLNQILVANGLDKVRPQMMYNYLRNGLLVRGQKIYGQTLRSLTAAEVEEFLIRYCVRNDIEIKVGEPKVSPDQLSIDDLLVTEA